MICLFLNSLCSAEAFPEVTSQVLHARPGKKAVCILLSPSLMLPASRTVEFGIRFLFLIKSMVFLLNIVQ